MSKGCAKDYSNVEGLVWITLEAADCTLGVKLC